MTAFLYITKISAILGLVRFTTASTLFVVIPNRLEFLHSSFPQGRLIGDICHLCCFYCARFFSIISAFLSFASLIPRITFSTVSPLTPPPPPWDQKNITCPHSILLVFLAELNLEAKQSQCDCCLPTLSLFLIMIRVPSMPVQQSSPLHVWVCGQVHSLERWWGRSQHLRSALSEDQTILWAVLEVQPRPILQQML